MVVVRNAASRGCCGCDWKKSAGRLLAATLQQPTTALSRCAAGASPPRLAARAVARGLAPFACVVVSRWVRNQKRQDEPSYSYAIVIIPVPWRMALLLLLLLLTSPTHSCPYAHHPTCCDKWGGSSRSIRSYLGQDAGASKANSPQMQLASVMGGPQTIHECCCTCTKTRSLTPFRPNPYYNNRPLTPPACLPL